MQYIYSTNLYIFIYINIFIYIYYIYIYIYSTNFFPRIPQILVTADCV